MVNNTLCQVQCCTFPSHHSLSNVAPNAGGVGQETHIASIRSPCLRVHHGRVRSMDARDTIGSGPALLSSRMMNFCCYCAVSFQLTKSSRFVGSSMTIRGGNFC